jgi:flagellar basal body-associated protein FliL
MERKERAMKYPIKNQDGLSAIVIILVLIILLGLAGGGFIAFQKAQKKNQPPMTSFEHIALKEDVVTFAFAVVPALYNRLVWVNTEITLIDKELDRLSTLENDFPSQKKVVKAERAMWVQLRINLSGEASSAEKKADSFYVAYMVNKQKGKEVINENLEELIERIDEILEAARKETVRLKIIHKKTLMDKIKGLIS